VARTKFRVEVLTPEGAILDEDVEMVSTRTTIGSIGLLAHHEPLLAMLEPTELRLYRSENEILRFAQAEGYLQFAENRALILVEEAIAPERLSASELEERAQQARSDREKAAAGSEAQARAERDLLRAEAFLQVLEGS
jgi:F-type H+-transporting ATPase subunit epsilon